MGEDEAADFFEEGLQQDGVQAVGIENAGSEAEQSGDGQTNEAGQSGAEEKDVANVLEDVLNLESEKAKDIVMGCIGDDRQSFLGAYEEAMRKKQEDDSIRYVEKLEKRLAGIDEKIQRIFVVGNYEDHYRLYEKAIICIAGQISANARGDMAKKVNGWVSARKSEKVMRELESRIKVYEAKYSREKGREEEYKAEIEGIESGLRNDKFELDVLSKSISQMEGYVKKTEDISSQQDAAVPQTAEETEKMRRDISKLYKQQHSAARRINKNAAIFSWKQSFYMNMNLTRDESEHVLEQLKSHHEILGSMINDYKKCGIAVELKEGRIMLREMRKTQEGLRQIQDELSNTLVESARMRGSPTNALPVYPGSVYGDVRDVMEKMRGEECLKAYQNLDNIFGRKS